MKKDVLDERKVKALVRKLGGMPNVEAVLEDNLMVLLKPQKLEVNRHGHYTLSIVGRSYKGAHEIELIMSDGKMLLGLSEFFLRHNVGGSGSYYNKHHRLVDGKEYQMVIIPGRELKGELTTTSIQEYALRHVYGVPRAGAIPRICEMISYRQMEEMNLSCLIALHDPIPNGFGQTVLSTHHHVDGCVPSVQNFTSDTQWKDMAGFVYFASDNYTFPPTL